MICHEAWVVAVFIFGCLRHRDIRMALLPNVARVGKDQHDVRLSGSEDVAAAAQPLRIIVFNASSGRGAATFGRLYGYRLSATSRKTSTSGFSSLPCMPCRIS